MSVNVNCPITGTITADGTADLEVLYMQVVNLGAPDATFDVTADAFSQFTLAEESSGSTVEYVASLADAAAFKTALGGWLKGGAKNATAQTVEVYMREYLRGEINALLSSDGVGAALEASAVKNLAFTKYDEDAQAGADGLIDALNADQSAKNSIGLQLPKARYPETFSSSLPAQSGDSLTFQFTITSTIAVSDSYVDVSTETDASGNANPTIVGQPIASVNRSRIVNIVATKA